MPRTLLKVFGGWWWWWWVVVVLESEFSVHLWSEVSAEGWAKLNNCQICHRIVGLVFYGEKCL